MPPVETRVYSSLRLRPSPHRLSAPMCGPRLEHTHLSPEVLAQGGLCCPTPHRLATSSASLRNSASLPGFAGYRRGLWHSRAILPAPPDLPDFHHCTFQDCRLQLSPGAPVRAPQFFRTGTGHRIKEKSPWRLQIPARISFMRSLLSTTGSFAFATALLFACLAGLTRPEGLNVPPASRGFYFRAFRSPGHPESLPDITTTPN